MIESVLTITSSIFHKNKQIDVQYMKFCNKSWKQTYQDDRQEALETIQNMRMSAMLIEEGEIKKGYKGLVILEAYYGAIENIVDPNVSIEDIVNCILNSLFIGIWSCFRCKNPTSLSNRRFQDLS